MIFDPYRKRKTYDAKKPFHASALNVAYVLNVRIYLRTAPNKITCRDIYNFRLEIDTNFTER